MKCFPAMSVGSAFVLVAALTLVPAGQAAAQHVCPAGPGPNEQVVGQTPGSGGVSLLLCEWNDAGPAVASPPPSGPIWGAVTQASDGSTYFSWQFMDEESANQSAMNGCVSSRAQHGVGGDCKIHASLSGQFAAVARGKDGRDYVGVWVSIAKAKENALKGCLRKSADCKIVYLMSAAYGPLDVNSRDLI